MYLLLVTLGVSSILFLTFEDYFDLRIKHKSVL